MALLSWTSHCES